MNVNPTIYEQYRALLRLRLVVAMAEAKAAREALRR